MPAVAGLFLAGLIGRTSMLFSRGTGQGSKRIYRSIPAFHSPPSWPQKLG
jgi:hypothetical protein